MSHCSWKVTPFSRAEMPPLSYPIPVPRVRRALLGERGPQLQREKVTRGRPDSTESKMSRRVTASCTAFQPDSSVGLDCVRGNWKFPVARLKFCYVILRIRFSEERRRIQPRVAASKQDASGLPLDEPRGLQLIYNGHPLRRASSAAPKGSANAQEENHPWLTIIHPV